MSSASSELGPPLNSSLSSMTPAEIRAMVAQLVRLNLGCLRGVMKELLLKYARDAGEKIAEKIQAQMATPATQLFALLRYNESELVSMLDSYFVSHVDDASTPTHDDVDSYVDDKLIKFESRIEALELLYEGENAKTSHDSLSLEQLRIRVDALHGSLLTKQEMCNGLQRRNLEFSTSLRAYQKALVAVKAEQVQSAQVLSEMHKFLSQSPMYRPSEVAVMYFKNLAQEPLSASASSAPPPPVRASALPAYQPAPPSPLRPPSPLAPMPRPAAPSLSSVGQAVAAAVHLGKRARASSLVGPPSAPDDEGWTDEDEPLDEPPKKAPTPPSVPLPELTDLFADEPSSDEDIPLHDL